MTEERARYLASYPAGQPGHEAWERAFVALCQSDNGAPLARLLRSVASDGGRGMVPVGVLGEIAQLRQPTTPWSRFGKAPDRTALRLKAVAVTDAKRDLLKRDERIWAEVLQLLQQQQGEAVTEAIRTVADRHGLSERKVASIWSDARRQQGEGMIPKSRGRPR